MISMPLKALSSWIESEIILNLFPEMLLN